MKFTIEKVSNMIMISSGEVVYKAWDAAEVTDRKLQNAMKKIAGCYLEPVTFEKRF